MSNEAKCFVALTPDWFLMQVLERNIEIIVKTQTEQHQIILTDSASAEGHKLDWFNELQITFL